MKTYYDFMLEIKADELYDRLVSYGMFSEKLPPIFTGDLFLNYCKNIRKQTFSDEWRGYINYESMRNTNIPRNIGIPTPMGHELLCKTLMEHWTELTEYFMKKTKGQPRIISRIHIRKMQETIVLLSKLDSKKYISVELPMDNMDLTSAESKATYKKIQNYVLEKFGVRVSTLYIAQVKRKYGLEVREHYNISKNENQKVLQCPIEKEKAILDALKYFHMIK